MILRVIIAFIAEYTILILVVTSYVTVYLCLGGFEDIFSIHYLPAPLYATCYCSEVIKLYREFSSQTNHHKA